MFDFVVEGEFGLEGGHETLDEQVRGWMGEEGEERGVEEDLYEVEHLMRVGQIGGLWDDL